LLLITLVGGFFTRQNLRAGRGDRRGAARLSYCIFGLGGVSWLFSEYHVASSWEMNLFIYAVGRCFLITGLVWLAYMALEPFVRRHWPDVLISWNRLLAGKYRDPLVGRDLLMGCVLGVCGIILHYLRHPIPMMFDSPQLRPSTGMLRSDFLGSFQIFAGYSQLISMIFGIITAATLITLGICFILFLVRFLSRRTWIAVAVLMIFVTLVAIMGRESIISSTPIYLFLGIYIFVYFRYGLLACVTALISLNLLNLFPITTRISAFYANYGFVGLTLVLVFTLYAFYTSLGGRPVFGTPRLDE
jgi:serine/threonine-protein kinase